VITVLGGPFRQTLSFTVSAFSAATFLTTPAALAAPVGSAAAPKPEMSRSLQLQLAAVHAEKAGRTPVQRKIDSQLLYAEKLARHVAFPRHFPKLATSVATDAAGRVLVDVQGRVTPRLLADVAGVHGRVALRQSGTETLRVQLPLTKLEDLAAVREVAFIARPEEPQLAVGNKTSEGDTTHRAAVLRAAFGVSGAGVKVGVLSDGIKSLAQSKATGDLGPVTVLPGQAGPADGDEGTAMLEIVHDIAPGAQLYFATAFNSAASFAQNIRNLRAAGCDVIVDDVFYFNEGAFQDGPIAQAVNDVTADGALYFSSAGNSGNLTDGTSGVWEGDASSFVPGAIDMLSYNFVDFDPTAGGVQTQNPMAGNSMERAATLQWSDPLGASSNDYDLFLIASDGSSVLNYSVNNQTGSQDPYERLAVPAGLPGARMLIGLYSGSPRFMHLSLNRGRFASSGTGLAAYATAGMTTGHSAAMDAFSVAATPAHLPFGAGQPTGPYPNPFSSSNVSETFTSDGPRRMFYAEDGTPYTPDNFTSTGGVVRQKPDITAADGVATTVAGFKPFYGTSAAAPHAGAIAALLLDVTPSLTPAQLRTALTSTAIDIEAPGYDRDTGAGVVDAYAAALSVAADPSALTITAPASVNYNASATIATKLTSVTTHAALAGQPVKLYKRANATKPWALFRTLTTSGTGAASTIVAMTANTQFQWRFAGGAGHYAATSATRTVLVKQLVSIAKTRSTITHGSTVKFYGTVQPTSQDQPVYLQQRVGTRWLIKSGAVIRKQTMPNGAVRVGYILKIRLDKTGTFTFRVFKPATRTLAAGYSATTSVKVT
jgi:hypothetical protein